MHALDKWNCMELHASSITLIIQVGSPAMAAILRFQGEMIVIWIKIEHLNEMFVLNAYAMEIYIQVSQKNVVAFKVTFLL